MRTKLFRRIGMALIALVAVFGASMIASPAANADAGTCIAAPAGWMCTSVYGHDGHVDAIGTSRGKVFDLNNNIVGICNYSAWFFAYYPGQPVQDLGIENRAGCGPARVWLIHQVHLDFPIGTQVCAKFYENNWADFVGQRCVGLSQGHWYSW